MGVGDRESGVEGFKNENIETAAEKAWRDQTRGVLIREAVQEHSGGQTGYDFSQMLIN